MSAICIDARLREYQEAWSSVLYPQQSAVLTYLNMILKSHNEFVMYNYTLITLNKLLNQLCRNLCVNLTPNFAFKYLILNSVTA